VTPIEKLLSQLPKGDLQFMQLLDAIYQTRFTGPITLDCLNGVPRQITLGRPITLAICSAATQQELADDLAAIDQLDAAKARGGA
jgi:hypothetical protein